MDSNTEGYFSNLVWLIDNGCSGDFKKVGSEVILEGLVTTGVCPSISQLVSKWSIREDKLGICSTARSNIKAEFLWDYATKSGKESLALNFTGTHHSYANKGLIISDRFAEINNHELHDWPVPIGSINQYEKVSEFLDYRWHPSLFDHDQLLSLLGSSVHTYSEEYKKWILKLICRHSTFHNFAVMGTSNDTKYDFIAARYSLLSDFKGEGFQYNFGQEHKQSYDGVQFKLAWLLDQCVGRIRAEVSPDDRLFIVGGGDNPFLIAYGKDISSDCMLPEGATVFDIASTILDDTSINQSFDTCKPLFPSSGDITTGIIEQAFEEEKLDIKSPKIESFTDNFVPEPTNGQKNEIQDYEKIRYLSLQDYAYRSQQASLVRKYSDLLEKKKFSK